jgi:hypothetical protein
MPESVCAPAATVEVITGRLLVGEDGSQVE